MGIKQSSELCWDLISWWRCAGNEAKNRLVEEVAKYTELTTYILVRKGFMMSFKNIRTAKYTLLQLIFTTHMLKMLKLFAYGI